MEAVTSTPGLMALFSGHDHGDTWCYKWDRQLPGMTIDGKGLNICFGSHSGYGGYGTWVSSSCVLDSPHYCPAAADGVNVSTDKRRSTDLHI